MGGCSGLCVIPALEGIYSGSLASWLERLAIQWALSLIERPCVSEKGQKVIEGDSLKSTSLLHVYAHMCTHVLTHMCAHTHTFAHMPHTDENKEVGAKVNSFIAKLEREGQGENSSLV